MRRWGRESAESGSGAHRDQCYCMAWAALCLRRARQRIASLLLVLVLAGCAVTADGIGPAHHAPDADKVSQVKDQLQQNAQAAAPAAARADIVTAVTPGIVVVGTTGPLRTIEDKNRAGFYAAYLKAADQWHPGTAAMMNHEEFERRLAGWASLEIAGIPGIGSIRMRMLVPEGVVHDTQFASTAGSFLIGTTGDLVVARTDDDGLLWLDHVLCRDDHGYASCAKDYQKGVFDKNSGQALDRNRKPKPHGATLDLASFKVVTQPGAPPPCSAAKAMNENCFDR